MANKALSTRQKLMIRVEPSQKALKARNPIAPGARQRFAEPQQNVGTQGKQSLQKLLKKSPGRSDDS